MSTRRLRARRRRGRRLRLVLRRGADRGRRAPTAARACRGAASIALEQLRDLRVFLVEVVCDPDTPLQGTELSGLAPVAKWPEARDGLAGPRDDDLLARLGALDETREMRLCLVDVDWESHGRYD